MWHMSGNFPIQLATRLPDWSAGGLLRCIVLPICLCVVSFSKFHESDTHDLLRTSHYPVSYTHLTLPTIYSV